MKKRVLLIGTGLIGCSLALAIKKEHEAVIIGHDISEKNLADAKRLNIIDQASSNIKEEVISADLIILAAPVDQSEAWLEVIAGCGEAVKALVTDVGSTKGRIMESAKILQENGVTFIGGHPMAGSHKTGPESAKAHLFENAFYMLTCYPETPSEKTEQLKNWLKGTKAKFIEIDIDGHDWVTGVVSHFPHLIAASLVRQAENQSVRHPLVSELAAGGFRDITRIASSSPAMWRDITKHNRETLLQLLKSWRKEMDVVEQLVENGEGEELLQYFSGAKRFRDSLPVRSKGAITSYYDLYIDVIDQPGVISNVTALLADHHISITNIQIIEMREDVYGVLRISFQSSEDRDKASDALQSENYHTYVV
ncbi:prephenate dehydrogenase [Fictibacillus aquaticus]|uniref:Prephenate dehydrogenase n=1 Tax=Fictibacillus aquaticus TaxID=2021314 RepID=A0A235FDE4_9BACL|nr:prephenate dehydrogenase [Fictibacillus aquaticus]OYD59259.1 prephenate dehydrogenase [Fictibacillus aquaticus]